MENNSSPKTATELAKSSLCMTEIYTVTVISFCTVASNTVKKIISFYSIYNTSFLKNILNQTSSILLTDA